MQLKGLVRFFTIALVLISLYQLSFTWIVRSHESAMSAQTDAWANKTFPNAETKYPADKARQAFYSDSVKLAKDMHYRRLLDSTRDASVGPFGLTTYQNAKNNELMLGLDLQGGMSVTMEVGLDGLIRSLSNYTKDAAFNKALDAAIQKKGNTKEDLVTLFGQEYEATAGGGKLAPLFASRSQGQIKYESSNADVLAYLRKQADGAFDNTLRILTTRIDRFGLASPNINPDKNKGIINIELPGANDPERIRRNLQATANLQFFEVYTISSIGESLRSADDAVKSYLTGIKSNDTSSVSSDTSHQQTIAAIDTNKTHTFGPESTVTKTTPTTKTDTAKNKKSDNPIVSLFQSAGQYQGQDGKVHDNSFISVVSTKDTGLLNSYLNMDIVKSKFPANLKFLYGKYESNATATTPNPDDKNKLYLYAVKTLDNGEAELDGTHVTSATPQYDEGSKLAITMGMDEVGKDIWAKMTTRNVHKPIAIVLDDFVYSAPFVDEPIPNGTSRISGNYSLQEATDLSNILTSGKLAAPAKIVASQEVGPTLGQKAVTDGSLSFLIAFIIIFALMLIYYNTAGWVANIALILNLLFTVAILTGLGFTLTAPGIAGLVLTVGMAVDTNVIIFERIKEELTKGKGYLTAVADGYKRSYAPVLDAHVTTLLTALILFKFGLGPVLGFATTQIIGILLSLFCGILVSRMIADIYTNKQRHFEYFTGISKKVFRHAAYKFIEYRKIAYGISVVVLLLGIGSFIHGFDEGVDFSGGRSYTILFDNAPNRDDVANQLKTVFGEYPTIKTVDKDNQLNITTAYKIKEPGNMVDSTVEHTLYTGLQKFLPANTSYATFDTKYKQASQTVLPSISDDLKTGAQEATVIAIIVICIYIFLRFRDWRYSIGTIVSLLHDVLVTLAVFSFAKGIVPFPLQIDQYFIAAILTVIGFSMNDTIIVYDRIREDSRIMKGADKATIINTAINQTLSRTVMTSLTVFLTILILFIFGGEVTRGFAFAMLIGVITGTYSSIFVAAPILVDFARNRPLGRVADDTKKK